MTQKMPGTLSRERRPGTYTNKASTAKAVVPVECRLGCGNTTRAKSRVCAPCEILGLAGHRKLRRSFLDK